MALHPVNGCSSFKFFALPALKLTPFRSKVFPNLLVHCDELFCLVPSVTLCAVPGQGSVTSRDTSSPSLGLFSLPVHFLTEFKTEKQMGFMISPVLLSRFYKVSPQASLFLCTDSVQPQGCSIISANHCFFAISHFFFFLSVTTYLCLHSQTENVFYHPGNFLELERGVRRWQSALCYWIIES